MKRNSSDYDNVGGFRECNHCGSKTPIEKSRQNSNFNFFGGTQQVNIVGNNIIGDKVVIGSGNVVRGNNHNTSGDTIMGSGNSYGDIVGKTIMGSGNTIASARNCTIMGSGNTVKKDLGGNTILGSGNRVG